MSDQVEEPLIATTEPVPTTEPESAAPQAAAPPPSIISSSGQFPQLAPAASPPSTLITVLSILVGLVGILYLFSMDYSPLSHTRSDYYLQTLSSSPQPLKLRLGTFNVRYAPSGPLKPLRVLKDTFKGKEKGQEKWGESGWEERREKLVDQVLFSELDVVGFQEVLDHQYKDLQVLMGDEFGFVGVGRNDGKKAGEAVPIFYRKSRFSLSSYKHSWLSTTPDVPGSKSWDAGQPRMVTIARLKDLQSPSSDEIIVANTHWDDRGLEARTNSAKLILELVREEMTESQVNGKEPLVVLLGDLNSPAEEKGYQVLTGDRYKKKEEKKSDVGEEKAFWDSRHELATRKTSLAGPGALSGAYGPHNTFTGFLPSDTPKIIDFILLFDNAAFISPHLPLPPSPDSSFLDADDPDELSATLSDTESLEPLLDGGKKDGQTKWKVSRYGVLPNFYEDIGGKRNGKDALIVSDHRLVVVGLEQVVA